MSLARKIGRAQANERRAAGATHKLFADTAKEICGAFYEDACSIDPTLYKLWPKPGPFIRAHWQQFVPAARDSLLAILAGEYSEIMKAPIFEAFLQDSALNAPQSHIDRVLH